MQKPTIHLNGSSRQSLCEGYREAAEAIYRARKALHDAAPNARDYYIQGPDAYPLAVQEHLARDQKLKAIHEELVGLLEAVVEG
jgi:hypothetical protein